MNETQDKWNLLFIFPDQQRYDTLAAYGNNKLVMPHLNQLAEQSAVFKRAYVTQPVCTPSRASILTGLLPHNHGCEKNNKHLVAEVPTLPELLRDEDYRTGYIGKWHLGNETKRQHGFDEWISIEDYYGAHNTDPSEEEFSSYHHFLIRNGFLPDEHEDGKAVGFTREFCTRLPERFSKPAFIADETSRFIEENKERPFIAYVSFLEPHPPYFSAFDDMYHPDEVDLPELFHDELPDNVPLKYHAIRAFHKQIGRNMPMKDDEQIWRRLIARYWGACSLIDKSVGRILNTLEANGLMDKTIIVFTSDHGEMMGDYKMVQKSVMYDPAVRVPLLVKVPGAEPFAYEHPVSHVDLVPTLLDLLGAADKAHALDGQSLKPLLVNGPSAESEQRDVFYEWNGEEPKQARKIAVDEQLRVKMEQSFRDLARVVVTPDLWKLSLTEGGENELYDLKADPGERRNLYFDAAYSEQKERLTRKIAEWQQRTNDTARVLPVVTRQ